MALERRRVSRDYGRQVLEEVAFQQVEEEEEEVGKKDEFKEDGAWKEAASMKTMPGMEYRS